MALKDHFEAFSIQAMRTLLWYIEIAVTSAFCQDRPGHGSSLIAMHITFEHCQICNAQLPDICSILPCLILDVKKLVDPNHLPPKPGGGKPRPPGGG